MAHSHRYTIGGIEFDRTELRDLAAAWVALAVACTFFLSPQYVRQQPFVMDETVLNELGSLFILSMLTVGTAFLLHELAHKVVAIQFGQVAAFRADYGFLFIAIISGLAGFLFAAPGAVYHRGRITDRQHGLIAVAGPVTNIGLAALFFVPFMLFAGFIQEVAQMGVIINLFLAAFNMIPFGPLDGKTVINWHKGVFALVLVTAVGAGAAFLLTFGF